MHCGPDIRWVLQALAHADDTRHDWSHLRCCAACQQTIRRTVTAARSLTGCVPCEEIDVLASLPSDDHLEDGDTAAILRHFVECPVCRDAFDGWFRGPDPEAARRGERRDVAADGAHCEDELPVVDPDKYEFLHELNRGGMGRIIEVRERALGRSLVIKEPLLHKAANFEERERTCVRFEHEARMTACLNHPNIVAVTEVGQWPWGTPFYSMKKVPRSESLRARIRSARSQAQRLHLLPHIIDAARAVSYAHMRGVVHRDLSPRNILIGEYGETVVIDWGLAKWVTDDKPIEPLSPSISVERTVQTATGCVIGTLPYMAPEQMHGASVDQRADVYALGALLYHAITNVAPYRDQAPDERGAADSLLALARTCPPTPVRRLAPRTPAPLCTIIARAMARDRDERIPNADELAQHLLAFTDNQRVVIHAYSIPESLGLWFTRHKHAFAAVLFSALVLLVGAAVALHSISSSERMAQANAERASRSAKEAKDRAQQVQVLFVRVEDALAKATEANEKLESTQTELKEKNATLENQTRELQAALAAAKKNEAKARMAEARARIATAEEKHARVKAKQARDKLQELSQEIQENLDKTNEELQRANERFQERYGRPAQRLRKGDWHMETER